MIYQWKPGSRFKVDAGEVVAELATLGKVHEPCTVVAQAKRKDSCFHECFEWDNGKAADEYRLQQARELLRSIVTVIDKTDEPSETISVRTFEHVDLGEGADPRMAYVPTIAALRKPELRDQIIGRLNAAIEESERTAEKYEYLCGGFAIVKKRLTFARKAIPAV